jgi:ABC-type sugar transport system ATPase subunit
MTEAPLVGMRGIIKRFPGVTALDGVDFDLRPGEVHGLVGENGSGKSTLVKCLYGFLEPDEGTIEINGVPVRIESAHKAQQLGIVAITQEGTLAPTLTVAENILMGRLAHGRFGINWRMVRRQAREALDQTGAQIDESAIVRDLSVELQQEVEIARAVYTRSKVIVLDEATSSLSEVATARLMETIERLRSQGVAIIYISHRLREVFQCCSRATVLRDGKLVGTVDIAGVSESDLVTKMVGRAMEDLYGKRRIPKGNVILSVRNLSTENGHVKDASLDLHEGEILGIAGLVGSGKVELGMAIFGAMPSTGDVVADGHKVKPGDPRAGMAAGIGFVPDDRKEGALLLTRSIRPNLSLPWMRFGTFTNHGVLNVRREKAMARDSCRSFAVRAPSPEFPVVQLSGGNQQKVVLARWFALSPKVVILAEPTRGIDVGAKSEIYGFMQDMAEKGAGIIMISSEMPELLGVADRILVMYQGRLCGEFDPREAGEEEIAHVACIGEMRTSEMKTVGVN